MILPELQKGRLLRRYKRFLADIETAEGEVITVHCPNTGAMTGCADPGSVAYFSVSDNPKRKYPYTLEFVETAMGLVSVNTGRANALVGEALAAEQIISLAGYTDIKAESKIPDGGGRFDFLARNAKQVSAFIEVKSVTLYTENGAGEFPDAVSERALKHVHALKRMVSLGHRGVLIFCAQHCGISRVSPARSIDPAYAQGLEEAIEAGVEGYAAGCVTDLKTMRIDRAIVFSL
ncbi:MAG: DNA/RNA nuclease SfsA [Proteobacteria bacterium]|nr:DNA/RNA nuclease SfsA [Pseudomonadota bacterium]